VQAGNEMPKIVDHDSYRRELADRCMELFSRKGYANVTMREIAKELGVSTGLLYHYFPTKEAIFAHMAKHLGEKDVSSVLNQVDDSASIDEKLRVYADHWREQKEYYKSIVLLAIDFIRNYRGPADQMSRVKKEYVKYYVDAMAENLGVPEELSRFIYVHMIGLFYYDLVLPETAHFDDQLDLFLDVYLSYASYAAGAGRGSSSKRRSGRLARKRSGTRG